MFKANPGYSKCSRPAWTTEHDPGWPGKARKTSFQNKAKEDIERILIDKCMIENVYMFT